MRFTLGLIIVACILVAIWAHVTGDTFVHAFYANSIFAAFGGLAASMYHRSK